MSAPLSLVAQPTTFAFEPPSTAILVIDMQNDFGSPGGMFDLAGVPIHGIQAAAPRIAAVLDAGRRARMPVIYVKMGFRPDLSDLGGPDAPNRERHQPMRVGEEVSAGGRTWRILVRGGWGTEIIEALRPEPGDIELWKHRYSAFFETELDAILKQRGVRSLVITGCTTSVCIESTVRDAFFRDYRCLLLSDCMAEPIGEQDHESTLRVLSVLFAWTAPSDAFLTALGQPIPARAPAENVTR